MGNKPSQANKRTLSDADVNELSSLSGFTPQQVREWHSGFLKDCPSGKLNKKKNLLKFTNNFIQLEELKNFVNMFFVHLILMDQAI